MAKQLFILFILGSLSLQLYAQPNFPEDGTLFSLNDVKKISVTVDPDSLALMLLILDKENPLQATVQIETEGNIEIIQNIGFRLRGNTSLDADKKSWKLDFNKFVKGQRFQGLEKLNLKGMHNDPTIVRSKLCWDLFRDYNIPAPRAAFTELFINGDNYGVFCMVEHIDEQFVDSRFGNDNGNLFKCTWPADLTWQGTNPNNYSSYGYELKTNEVENNISDLIDFIYVLNNSTNLECELSEIFNINSYLKCMAIDVFTGNWDGPLYNKNNFYLYHNTQTGLFEYIPYDLDNTWGINWGTIDWGNRNIYNWHNNSEPRPLFTRIMLVPAFRDKFTDYMAQLISHVDNNDYIDEVNDLAVMLAAGVGADPYYPLTYGYDLNDFFTAFSAPLPGGYGHDDDYGIISYITERSNTAEAQLDLTWDFAPSITYFDVEDGFLGDNLILSTIIEDDMPGTNVWLDYELNGDGNTLSLMLLDDGMSGDETAGDGIYTASISSSGINLIEGQVRAEDASGLSSIYPCNPSHIRDLEFSSHQLYINEFMASNSSTLADEAGEYDDWIELYNGGETNLFIGNYFLTDNFEKPNKFKLPNLTLAAGEYYIIWADKDETQGFNHANFKLEASGEEIAIFEPILDHFKPIDLIRYTDALEDVSYGYLPDASQPVVTQDFPTPNSANGVNVSIPYLQMEHFSIYPNPTSGSVYIDAEHIELIEIFDMNLRLVQTAKENNLNLSLLQSGTYFIRISDDSEVSYPLQKIIKN